MNKNFLAFRTGTSALLAVGALVAVGLVIPNLPAAAQQTEDEEVALVVTVTAPRTIKEEVGTSAIGATIEVVKVSHDVVVGDLDLARHSARNELDRRIEEAAKEACNQIDTLYPLGPDPDCVKNAIEGAQAQKDAVVAAFK